MKILNVAFSSCLLASVLQAYAPHPSVLTAKYQDQMLPVIKVLGTDPVVIAEDQERRIRVEPTYLLQRAPGYADEYVQFLRVSLSGAELKVVASAEEAVAPNPTDGPRFGTSFFEATVKSKNLLKGGFAAVVIYALNNAADDASPFTGAQMIVHDLPDLPAGEEVPVKFSAAIPNGLPNQRYFVQLFDGFGREVMTSNMDPAWQYYALRDRAQLQDAVGRYQEKFRGSDHAAVPVVMARPVFKDGLVPPTTAVSALIMVSAAGTVSGVDVRGVDDANVRHSITEALSGWLFLPQLKAGVPVATKVQVPLKF